MEYIAKDRRRDRIMNFLGKGGVGSVLSNFNRSVCGFGLKIVIRSREPSGNQMFWEAAKSIQAWTANIRFHVQFSKLPLAQQYWIKESDCRTFEKKQRLSDLIACRGRLGDISECPEALKDIDPREYVLCPEDLLAEIYDNDRCGYVMPYHLLVTYPVQQGESTLASCIDRKIAFSEHDLLSCCYQILSAIDYLYERKCAHRDIKPSNILIDENKSGEKLFRLIDFDAFHSTEYTSTAGSELFLPAPSIYEELKKQYQPLEFRVLLDCFALAQTIICMHRKNQKPSAEFALDLPPLVKELYRIQKFKPSDIKPLLAELKNDCLRNSYNYACIFNRTYDFDKMGECYLGTLGTFHEQIRFSEKFDPIIQNSEVNFSRLNIPGELFDILLFPVAHDLRNNYYHAPDNMYSGCRPINFHYYKPKSLSNTILSEDEQQSLIQKGRKLNEVLKNYKSSFFIPQKTHIVFVDGDLKLFWGMGEKVCRAINYEVYFSYLATNETSNFSLNDWLDFLPCCSELQDQLPQQISLKLLEILDTNTAWLFKIKQFREHIKGKNLTFSAGCWWEICQYTDEFDQYIDSTKAWEMFCMASGKQRGMLLKRSKIKEKLSVPPENFKMDNYLKAFFALRMYDENNFSRWFSESDYEKFSITQWGSILSVNPCLLKFMPKENFQLLDRKIWVRLLGVRAELLAQCPCLNDFNSKQWCSIILQQPKLKEYVPADIIFSDKEEMRLRKKQDFFQNK